MVKFLVVMSLEESLTLFVTHFINYSGLVHCTSGQTKGFFGAGGGGQFTV